MRLVHSADLKKETLEEKLTRGEKERCALGIVSARPTLRNLFASSDSRGMGILIFRVFSRSATMLKRLNGGVKSISTGGSSGPLAWYEIL